MESNRDEALKCLRLAEKYLAEANQMKAERFAQKSMNMFPNERAKGQSMSFFTNKSYFENVSVSRPLCGMVTLIHLQIPSGYTVLRSFTLRNPR